MIAIAFYFSTRYFTSSYFDRVFGRELTSIPIDFNPSSIDLILSLSLCLNSSIPDIIDFPVASAHAMKSIGNSSIRDGMISPSI